MTTITVALPVLNGGPLLDEVLTAVRAQQVDADIELLIADSGSTDGSLSVAERHGAAIYPIKQSEFSHGGTRNVLVSHAHGTHVAFLTQDATPANDRWLATLLEGFERADKVGLVYGPYVPRPDAPHWIKREFEEFFPKQRQIERPPGGHMPYFTDANGCVLREAVEQVPYRAIPYAEDQMLARDMLAAGWSKVYEPDAPVIHSHDYTPWQQFGRHFDEFRALREVHGHVQPARPRVVLGTLRREVRSDRAYLQAHGAARRDVDKGTLGSVRFHGLRATAAVLGSRADKLPPPVRKALSRDNRGTFDATPGA